jgi:glycosyltransferase involved in cell wall biosynthesis
LVRFYGEQTNPYRFMKNADLFLMTSYHEAAPMVIEEAACLQLPVLTARTTSSQDMVADAGIGWVCENTQADINAALLEVVSGRLDKVKKEELRGSEDADNSVALAQFSKLIEE